MADPRLLAGFEGIDGAYATFKFDAVTIVVDLTQAGNLPAATINKAVSLSGAATVQLCSDGEALVGKLISADPTGLVGDTFCTVQVEGFCSLPGGLAATLTLGTRIVGALGAASAKGFIRSAASATAAELIKLSAQIIDASDPTNVVVNF